jgi:predicted nucleotidyltransferase
MRSEIMLGRLLKNKKFNCKIRYFYKQHKNEVLDIILFGSTVKGKKKPEDIDILLLFKDKENLDAEYKLRRMLQEEEIIGVKSKVQITTKTYASFISRNFKAKEGILAEGYSLIHKESIAKMFGYINFILFRFTLKGFTQSRRMQFHYSLHGRKNEGGMMKELKLIRFADGVLLSPVVFAEKTKEYLKYWKIEFDENPMLIPERMKF